MSESKAFLESTHKVPVYVTWEKVPQGLFTKTALKRDFKIALPADAKPVAIKGGGMNQNWFFLYRKADFEKA